MQCIVNGITVTLCSGIVNSEAGNWWKLFTAVARLLTEGALRDSVGEGHAVSRVGRRLILPAVIELQIDIQQ